MADMFSDTFEKPSDHEETSISDDLDFSLPKGPPTQSLIRDGLQQSSMETPLPSTNIGYKLLKKMGWADQTGLGKNAQGRTEPIKIDMKEDKLGLGKQEEYDFWTDAERIKRKLLDTEAELEGGEHEQRVLKLKAEQAEKKEVIKAEWKETHRQFYCELCDKQYKNDKEMDNHLSSYDHAHKKRFIEMRAMAGGGGGGGAADKKRLKEQQREEREMKKMLERAAASKSGGTTSTTESAQTSQSPPPPPPPAAEPLAQPLVARPQPPFPYGAPMPLPPPPGPPGGYPPYFNPHYPPPAGPPGYYGHPMPYGAPPAPGYPYPQHHAAPGYGYPPQQPGYYPYGSMPPQQPVPNMVPPPLAVSPPPVPPPVSAPPPQPKPQPTPSAPPPASAKPKETAPPAADSAPKQAMKFAFGGSKPQAAPKAAPPSRKAPSIFSAADDDE